MKKYWTSTWLVTLVLLCFTLPVSANPGIADNGGQGGGGIRFGPYTLSAGDSVSGDLTVFGPVTLHEDSFFDGDLTVFGAVFIERGATVDGTLVVMGALELAGTVDGDVFTAGPATLKESAYVTGDLSAVGAVMQDETAVVEGIVEPLDEGDFDWNMPALPHIDIKTRHQPFWVTWFWSGMSTVFYTLVMALIALVLVSIWPKQVERVSQVVENAPLTAFGVGLLTLFLSILGFIILAITICLFPLGIIGLIIVGIGVLLGFVALGAVLGRRIWGQISQKPQPDTVISTIIGTGTLTLLLALAEAVWPLHILLFCVLIPPAAGAVLLTRFGMMPYASNGKPLFASTPATSAFPIKPVDVVPINVIDDVPDIGVVEAEVEITPVDEGEPRDLIA